VTSIQPARVAQADAGSPGETPDCGCAPVTPMAAAASDDDKTAVRSRARR